MKTIIFMPTAAKALDALPADDRLAAEDGLYRYATHGLGDWET